MTKPQINLSEPKVVVRAILGVLLFANLVAAAFAFHIIGDSPSELDAQLTSARTTFRAAQQHLNKSKTIIRNMDVSRDQGNTFLTSYMTDRKHTYAPLDGEINSLAKGSGMKVGDWNYSNLEPIEGTDDLSMLTITATFEGGYGQLVKFVNELDRSNRFLLIEQLQVAPQPKGDLLNATVKLNTFVREQNAGGQ